MKFGEIRKPLLIFCLITSVSLHLGVLLFLYILPYSFHLNEVQSLRQSTSHPVIIPKESEDLLVEKIEKALEESLNAVTLANAKLEKHNDLADREENIVEEISYTPGQNLAPKLQKEDLIFIPKPKDDFAASMPPPFDPEWEASLKDFALDDEIEADSFSYACKPSASIDFTDPHIVEDPFTLPKTIEDDYTMTDKQFSPTATPIQHMEGLDPHFVASLKKLNTHNTETKREIKEEKMFSHLSESTTPKFILPNAVDYLRNEWIKKSLADQALPNLEYYGLEQITTQLQWEEDIDIEIQIMQAPEGGKYIFSLSIQPEFEDGCNAMSQNFYFVLDRSSSIEKQKFNRFKRAVQRSLTALHEGDRFNIYIFDKNISKLSNKTLPVTPKTMQMAEEFLEQQNAKTHFASTEVYNSLEKMLPMQFDPDELHSVILITDGNTLLSNQKQKQALSSWAKKYEDTVNFYTAASGKGNNLVLLDLLSYCTAGKMIYSDTNAGFPRKLVRLIKNLHYPLVKNINIEVTPEDANARICLYPQNKHLSPMFANQPYVITGSIDELCDLTFYIQGKNHDKWLNIRKKLSLAGANHGGRSLEKLWAQTQSKICYDHFLKNGKNTHLKEAIQIMTPYRGTIAAEQ